MMRQTKTLPLPALRGGRGSRRAGQWGPTRRPTLNAPTLIVLVACTAATAQPAAYSLRPGSVFFRENCLPPCLCPAFEQSGPLTGDFTLEFLDSSPLFTRYRVSSVHWTAALPGEPMALTGAGIYSIGGELALVHRLQLSLTIPPLAVIVPFDSGFVPADPQHPFPAFRIVTTSGQIGCTRTTLTVAAAPVSCYANCDGSTSAPSLNVADFTCFLQRYAAGEPYANCDDSTLTPVLNVADFTCFLHRFAAGCS